MKGAIFVSDYTRDAITLLNGRPPSRKHLEKTTYFIYSDERRRRKPDRKFVDGETFSTDYEILNGIGIFLIVREND